MPQVPMDQGKNALDMITRFTKGEQLGQDKSQNMVASDNIISLRRSIVVS